MLKEATSGLLPEVQVRKIFNISFLCFCFFLSDVSTGSWAYSTKLPADVFFKARIKLKNREVKKEQNYLFTRVDLKPKSRSSASLLESKANLYAQRNFATYLFGQVKWKDNFTSTEQHMVQMLYWQVTSISGVLRGLTLTHSFSQNGLNSYIYAVNAPRRKFSKISQREAVDKIQTAVNSTNIPLDYFTYFEMALLKPNVFNPKIGVKRLGKIYGPNFIFFLLGMDLADPTDLTGIPKISRTQLIGLDKNEIAILLNERPYDAILALIFTKKLLETSHEELAKLVVKSGCRLEKSGDTYNQMIRLAKLLNVDPSGSYSYPVSRDRYQQLFLEAADAGVELNPLSEAILSSLGDVPLKSSNKQLFLPAIDFSRMNKENFLEEFHALQEKQKMAINKDLFEVTAELLNANSYPLMAYCFWHQALYLDPKNKHLRKKILDQANGIDFIRNSKLLSP